MIIKGASRGRARDLAKHLLHSDQNETVRLFECRGTVAHDLEGALREMEALALVTLTSKPLYHASISPEKQWPLTEVQVAIAADSLEHKLGLAGQPRVIVLHRKEGRDHVHVVWSRIDVTLGRALPDSWNYRHHEQAARELEARFGHPVLAGSRDTRRARPGRRTAEDHEYRQAECSGRTSRETASELSALWQGAEDARAFQDALRNAGYTLARGDRRVFVVIDRDGQVHSLGRRLGLRSRDLRARLPGLSLEALPSVAQARPSMRKRPPTVRALIRYRAAAQEATAAWPAATVRPRRVPRPDRPKPDIRIPAAQIAWINSAVYTGEPIARVRAQRNPRRSQRPRYHSERASIAAEYAAKIADAVRSVAPDRLNAVLDTLSAERTAALAAFSERAGAERQHERAVRRRFALHPRLLRFRHRIRRRLRLS